MLPRVTEGKGWYTIYKRDGGLSMRIIKAKNYQDMSRKAANVIAAQVILKEDSVLGLATGSTVIGIYERLAEGYQEGDLDFSKIKSINLDEYVGLPVTNENSYRYYMNTNLFDHINIPLENTHVPNGLAEDLEAECKRYDENIERLGGIDLQLLGLGHNGHIAFNEPSDEFPKQTYCVELKESTIEANSRFFENKEDVPKKAITMGIQTIMKAKRILLCVSGAAKAEILKKVLTGPITPQVPGSILQIHNNVIVIADEEAMSEL